MVGNLGVEPSNVLVPNQAAHPAPCPRNGVGGSRTHDGGFPLTSLKGWTNRPLCHDSVWVEWVCFRLYMTVLLDQERVECLGIEPSISRLRAGAFTTGGSIPKWPGRRGSNPLPPRRQRGVLPLVLRPDGLSDGTCPRFLRDHNPAHRLLLLQTNTLDRTRTCDLLLRKQVLFPSKLRA